MSRNRSFLSQETTTANDIALRERLPLKDAEFFSLILLAAVALDRNVLNHVTTCVGDVTRDAIRDLVYGTDLGLSDDLAAFEEQVAQFLIATLSTFEVNQRGHVSLTPLALAAPDRQLIISWDSKVKLGKPTLAWLHGLQLVQLRSILLSVSSDAYLAVGAELSAASVMRQLAHVPCAMSQLYPFKSAR